MRVTWFLNATGCQADWYLFSGLRKEVGSKMGILFVTDSSYWRRPRFDHVLSGALLWIRVVAAP